MLQFIASKEDYDKVVETAHNAYLEWRNVPAPKRGEIVRQIGDKLRKYKDPGSFSFIRNGKAIIKKVWVKFEMIDICVILQLGVRMLKFCYTNETVEPNYRNVNDQYHI
ncbi:MAG: aldehyde dehydrogenase family protein [Ignavibacteriales bacterium]|nr:aldehyde dehydrogenase family protein [Ignavibacteriales bacterium]